VIAYEQGLPSRVLDLVERHSEPEQALVTFDLSSVPEVLEEHCPMTETDRESGEIVDGRTVADPTLSVHDEPPRRSTDEERPAGVGGHGRPPGREPTRVGVGR
jgi:hypothetical protein